jgi:triacylglycerol lipase
MPSILLATACRAMLPRWRGRDIGYRPVVGMVGRDAWWGKRVARAAVGAGFLLIAVLPGVTPPAGAAQYPVPWSFLPSAILAAAANGPGVAPPGANVPCTPSSAHPDPVVLVHGLAADQSDNWQTLSPLLADNGYCVFTLTYGNDDSQSRPLNEIGGLAPMEHSARVLASFVDSVLTATHAAKVDLVGHSEGGTVPDYYLKFLGGSQVVSHFVSISGVLHGTTLWGVSDLYAVGEAYGFGSVVKQVGPLCASCTEFLPGTSFMQRLDAPNAVATSTEAATCPYDGAAVDGVAYTSLATNNDELVRPPTSDFIDTRCDNEAYGITVDNFLVQDQCPADQSDHLSIVSDPVAAQDVMNALDPPDQRPVPCTLVLPSIN